MGSLLPPDPYLALGVAKDASATAIKTQYRKLVLKFHPDKVKDESQKTAAADEFHKIQTAYEIIGDEDRRHRYDAQVKLADLRRDVASRGGDRGPEVKTAAYKFPTEPRGTSTYHSRGPERVSPTYEERKPAYATEDYFAQPPRTNSRKDRDDVYERSARYQPTRESHEKPRAAQKTPKESERSSRREKSMRTDKEIKRERDRKPAPARIEIVSDTSSDEDEYERAARRRDPEAQKEEQRRVKEQFWAQAARQKEEADRGHYSDERTRKMFSQHADAFEAIRSGGKRQEPSSRSAQTRPSSSKDNWKTAFAKVRQSTERPTMVSRDSQRSKTTVRDTEPQPRRSAPRDYERKASDEIIAEHRKPTLNMTNSSPTDIRMPTDKPRARSVQVETDDLPPQPQMRRAETMPTRTASTRDRDSRKSAHQNSSGLRQAEIPDGISPTASPVYPAASPDLNTYYRYRNQYADDVEYPTPDGYKTEVRHPAKTKKHTRSPSPIREKDRDVHEVRPEAREQRDSWEGRDPMREKVRAASARYAPQTRPSSGRTTSTSYVYNNDSRNVDPYSRPVPSRENSRDYLFGEVPTTTRSPQMAQSGRYSPPPESEYRPASAQYRTRQPEDIRPQTGYAYTRRGSEVRPSYTSRASSSAQHPVYAR